MTLRLPKDRGLRQSLGRWLKLAGRAYGCRCIKIEQVKPEKGNP